MLFALLGAIAIGLVLGLLGSGGSILTVPVLVYLAGRPGTVLNRDALLAHVWGWADATSTRTVDSHIKALRRKLGPDLIRTVHGVGYALELSR